MLDNLKLFVCAAQQLSLSKAALKLNMTIATVSRRIHELERQLGCELFHRSNKGLTLTPYGVSYYEQCAPYIHELELRLENLDCSLNSLSGKLKVTAPINIGNGPLDSFWKNFTSRYPDIQLTIELQDPLHNTIPYDADIAICSGSQPNSSLLQKKLGSITPILVTSSEARFPAPQSIKELMTSASIAAQLFSEWQLTNNVNTHTLRKEHIHTSNDMHTIVNLVKAGAGVALLPKSMVYKELATGELINILPDYRGVERELFLVWPYQRTLSLRAQCFKDKLCQFLAAQSWFNHL
ncbi:MAG: LysR family transcriptional regulator [Pseudoalteromonas sp.]|uniref:LysR family transcriptional regulator n=3 Tax=Pseudoalteromonas TaxID=53246 RepID=UPI003F9C9098